MGPDARGDSSRHPLRPRLTGRGVRRAGPAGRPGDEDRPENRRSLPDSPRRRRSATRACTHTAHTTYAHRHCEHSTYPPYGHTTHHIHTYHVHTPHTHTHTHTTHHIHTHITCTHAYHATHSHTPLNRRSARNFQIRKTTCKNGTIFSQDWVHKEFLLKTDASLPGTTRALRGGPRSPARPAACPVRSSWSSWARRVCRQLFRLGCRQPRPELRALPAPQPSPWSQSQNFLLLKSGFGRHPRRKQRMLRILEKLGSAPPPWARAGAAPGPASRRKGCGAVGLLRGRASGGHRQPRRCSPARTGRLPRAPLRCSHRLSHLHPRGLDNLAERSSQKSNCEPSAKSRVCSPWDSESQQWRSRC